MEVETGWELEGRAAVQQPFLALIGGEEFSDAFADVHAELLAMLGGGKRRAAFLPTCAADGGAEAVDYWCALAQEKLAPLGLSVETPRVVDSATANDADNARAVAEADWVYIGGGYPHVGMRVLAGSRVMDALTESMKRGSLISGASAGAMLMCARSFVMTPELQVEVSRVWEHGPPPDWNPPLPPPLDCFGWLPRIMCAPHFNRRLFPYKWIEPFLLPKGFTIVGIDEQTALVAQPDTGEWHVHGLGAVTIIGDDLKPARHDAGEKIALL